MTCPRSRPSPHPPPLTSAPVSAKRRRIGRPGRCPDRLRPGRGVGQLYAATVPRTCAQLLAASPRASRQERARWSQKTTPESWAPYSWCLTCPRISPIGLTTTKMLVHRRARRRGLGEALMWAAEQLGRDCGKTLPGAGHQTGGDAERLYARLGWQKRGDPNYALWPHGFCDTTYFYKAI